MNYSEQLVRNVAQLGDMPMMYQMLSEHGRTFKLKLTGETAKGKKQECYRNSENLATFSDRHLAYCEGYACKVGLIPLPHAWVLDLEDGLIIDPTWPEADTMYFGCAFNTEWVNKHTLSTGAYSVFQTLYLMRNIKRIEDVKAYLEKGLFLFD